MLVGLGICLFYMLMPRYFPIAFYEMSSVLSNATPEQATSYASLRQAYYLADPSAQRGGACGMGREARARSPIGAVSIPRFAGLFAVPAGLLTAALVSAFTPAPSETRRASSPNSASRRAKRKPSLYCGAALAAEPSLGSASPPSRRNESRKRSASSGMPFARGEADASI